MPRKIKQIRVEGNIAYVPLTNGYEMVIDVGDVHLFADRCWQARRDGNTVYARRTEAKSNKTFLAHRVIMGAEGNILVDHIDGDGLNNRRSNLRFATKSQNGANRRINRNNTSGYRGVSWSQLHGRWLAQIQVNRKVKFLGLHDTPEQAGAAHAAALAELFGGHGATLALTTKGE